MVACGAYAVVPYTGDLKNGDFSIHSATGVAVCRAGLRVKYVPAGCYNTLCVSLRVKYVPVMVQLSFIGQGL